MPLFFTACVTIRHCPIETLQPAHVILAPPKTDIVISAPQTVLTNIIISAPRTLLSDAVISHQLVNLPTDSIVANIMFSLMQLWSHAPGYEDAQITFQIPKNDETPKYSNYDLLVQLESLQIKNTYYGQEYSFLEWIAYLFVYYTAQWTITNASGILLDEYTDHNLMEWNSGMRSGKEEAVMSLPNVYDAWWDMGIVIARNYANRILPRWQTDTRMIYMINKFPELSKQAYSAMLNDGYARAIDIWDNILLQCRKRGQKKTKSRIVYNIAVAWEFQNQLDEAIHWTQQSAALKKHPITVNYLNLLNERKQNQIKLDQQAGN